MDMTYGQGLFGVMSVGRVMSVGDRLCWLGLPITKDIILSLHVGFFVLSGAAQVY